MSRILVACVGNLLRRDDGFGPRVAERLEGRLPAGAELVETGIGGVALVGELLGGCDGLVLVDALDEGLEPGTVVRSVPHVEEAEHVADVHLANPGRVLSIAKSMGALPERVAIVGCQAAEVDDVGEGLSPPVEAALPVAVEAVCETVAEWLGAPRPERASL